MVDLANMQPSERTIEILDPGSKRPVGVRVTVVSIDDDKLTKVKRAITDKRLYLEQRGKSFKSEDIEENRNNILLASITGWEWYNPDPSDAANHAMFNGEVPEFNRRNVANVITTLRWFGDQINEAIGETESFFQG